MSIICNETSIYVSLSSIILELTNLDDVKSDLNSPLGACHIRLNNLLDIPFSSLLGLREVFIKRHSAGSPNVLRPSSHLLCCGATRTQPWGDGGCFATGMSKLDANFLVLRVGKFDNFLERFHLRVKP